MNLRFLASLVLTSVLAACASSSIRPVNSAPPYSKIEVNTPFSWGAKNIFVIRLDYPKGTYLPTFEDDKGYYYQAPQKLTGSDSGMGILVDGGIYLEKNKVEPDRVYFVRGNAGMPATVKMERKENITLVD